VVGIEHNPAVVVEEILCVECKVKGGVDLALPRSEVFAIEMEVFEIVVDGAVEGHWVLRKQLHVK
jgi:hypothetical protein